MKQKTAAGVGVKREGERESRKQEGRKVGS